LTDDLGNGPAGGEAKLEMGKTGRGDVGDGRWSHRTVWGHRGDWRGQPRPDGLVAVIRIRTGTRMPDILSTV